MENTHLNEKICLCIDTSSKTASVAVGKWADGQKTDILYSVMLNNGLTHSEKLLPLVDQCLAACEMSAGDVDIFACHNGPGSFTGLRIGISTANAMAQSTGKEIIGINSLEAAAYPFRHFDGLVVPMIDARRDDVYTAAFDASAGFEKIWQDEIKGIDEILESLKSHKENIIFAGCGADKAAERAKMIYADRAKIASGINNYANAAYGVEIAFEMYFSSDYKQSSVLLPHYVKETSAKTLAEQKKRI